MPQSGEAELNTVVATDVLSEGLNMQDCDTIINYDLHWNPVRLIQRFGRIDRIGATHDTVWGLNFLPESELDRHSKSQADARTEDQRDSRKPSGRIPRSLDPTEKVSQEAMYAIYDDKPSNLDLFEPDELMGLSEAEGILRQLRADDPEEFDRIANLRDGLRSGMDSLTPGIYVMCQAGEFQQLFFVDAHGNVETRDASTILGRLKCTPSAPIGVLPPDYNASVSRSPPLSSLRRRGCSSENYTGAWLFIERGSKVRTSGAKALCCEPWKRMIPVRGGRFDFEARL